MLKHLSHSSFIYQYQASFCHHQVRPKPFFLTETIITIVVDVVATFQKLFQKAIAIMVILRHIWGLDEKY